MRVVSTRVLPEPGHCERPGSARHRQPYFTSFNVPFMIDEWPGKEQK